jgi:SAM-dependent methyltransferase
MARRLLEHRLPRGEHRVTDRLGLSYRVPDLHDPVAFDLLVNGVHEPEVLAVLLELLPANGTFLDIGAGPGAFALPAACRIGQGGRVVALEASPTLFQCLRANAAVNGLANVTAVQAGFSTLDRPQFDQLLLDANVRHVDVVKIDVKGRERKVLEATRTLLDRPQPPAFVFKSAARADAQCLLMEWGYTLWSVHGYRRRRAPLTAPLTTGDPTIIAKRV